MRRRTFLVGSAAALLASGAVNALATLRVQAGKEAEVEAILRDSQSATLANDKGCLHYEWYRASTPQTHIRLQRWSDQAAAQDQLNAPHIVSAVEKLLSLVLENPKAILLTKL
jgi:quinol monooxygenase YgiN